jgi:hypothetical protein
MEIIDDELIEIISLPNEVPALLPWLHTKPIRLLLRPKKRIYI